METQSTLSSETKSQKAVLERYLRGTNKTLTESQAQQMFGIKNLRARMTEMRQAGLRVRTVKDVSGMTAYAVSARAEGGQRKIVFA
jgi:hypothetical protein